MLCARGWTLPKIMYTYRYLYYVLRCYFNFHQLALASPAGLSTARSTPCSATPRYHISQCVVTSLGAMRGGR